MQPRALRWPKGRAIRRLVQKKLGFRALFGRLTQARDFESSLVHSLEVRSRHKRLLVAADGEIEAMETPLRYRIRPRALTVMVPERAAQKDAA